MQITTEFIDNTSKSLKSPFESMSNEFCSPLPDVMRTITSELLFYAPDIKFTTTFTINGSNVHIKTIAE